eukprot:GHVU01004715.1.p1 GENE.GHVU01004715.1~~GHVU01004715.1.p1  ORF type:complete len:120 (-),score=19.62 GHVU01004715.1:1608-1967(-)
MRARAYMRANEEVGSSDRRTTLTIAADNDTKSLCLRLYLLPGVSRSTACMYGTCDIISSASPFLASSSSSSSSDRPYFSRSQCMRYSVGHAFEGRTGAERDGEDSTQFNEHIVESRTKK